MISQPDINVSHWLKTYQEVRNHTEKICSGLEPEDFGAQPVVDVSPPKWHLGHTTWFFETFVLKAYVESYDVFHPKFNFVFNSYYNNVGERVLRYNRGDLTRPKLDDVYAYRRSVDEAMHGFLQSDVFAERFDEISGVITIGLQHEQQHQELLWTDLKYILGNQPLMPAYGNDAHPDNQVLASESREWVTMDEGLYTIGHDGNGFAFDNEYGQHQVQLNRFKIASSLVTFKEYFEFVEDGGYQDFNLWHDEGLAWVRDHKISSLEYVYKDGSRFMQYSLNGYEAVNPNEPVRHISFYEASAYARWKGMRLPTEFEWEAASHQFEWGARWEWTNSAYLPYPGYKIQEGAIGEYNGKFMINQMVLRGASVATSPNHARNTYRNFFHPQLRWQYTGIRLAQDD